MKHFQRSLLIVTAAIGIALGTAACHKSFDPKIYASNSDALFAASLRELNRGHAADAAKGFEQLTRDLPARDPLLPLSYYYLGRAQEKDGSHLLAAQSFARIADAFPDDSLADDALLASGRAYSKMWRKPELDAQYGASAERTLQSLVTLYHDSKLVPAANVDIARLDNMFAEKDLQTGQHYMHRGAYDSEIIYLKDVIRLHPTAPAAHDAYLSLLTSYRAIKYSADARDLCDAMTKNYPSDREVRQQCGSASSVAASTPRT
ncbi:MAG: outer membrane protein assembly factor BamD [Gemmatimonadaceae bacterium]